MGESACLLRSSFSHDDREATPVPALTGSISFGRFMSETLDWGKWSSFSSNKYLEEVEKYSTPGSVAQKKAFFEARYKRIAAKKAAAMLENGDDAAIPEKEQNIGTQSTDFPVSVINEESIHQFQDAKARDDESELNVDAPTVKQEVVRVETSDKQSELNDNEPIDDKQDGVIPLEEVSSIKLPVSDTNEDNNGRQFQDFDASDEKLGSSDSMPIDKHEDVLPMNEVSSLAKLTESVPFDEIGHSESKNKENAVLISETEILNAPQSKLNSPQQNRCIENPKNGNGIDCGKNSQMKKSPSTAKSAAATKVKIVSATKSAVPSRLNRPKPATPVHLRKEDKVTPNCKSSTRDLEKKRMTPKCLHMSINFSPHHASKFTPNPSRRPSSITEKIGASKVIFNSSKISKDSSNDLTNKAMKLPSATHQLEKRTKASLEQDNQGSTKMDKKCQSLCTDHSKTSSACGRTVFSSTASSPFNFKSEERAAKRKEYFLRLEEKSNAKVEKNLQPKSKEKVESELKKLRASTVFKGKPMPNFQPKTEPPKNLKKAPLTRPRSPKLGRRRDPSTAEAAAFLPFKQLTEKKGPIKKEASKQLTEKKGPIKRMTSKRFTEKNSQIKKETSKQLTEKKGPIKKETSKRFTEKNSQILNHSRAALENTSPNIQH